ncbi:dTDP-4-dehydrorhamnose reductase [Guptibacillus algicola]|uniref:dTDP-4-dehydrorhamnose reductase n=1 Tax=Guptibacillus algicola TaxID=225844 RepID=UPI001CD5372B|nr:dTDP-4-dehydrorhamnose reductase [Alkalihalobacillus algicola]MCA0987049.1 dTDP-4-dehydrorhamnose reductase [Alkalihalobacillus algicola]
MSEVILVTGSNGQLGKDVEILFSKNGYEVYGYSREQLDITKLDNVSKVFEEIKPSIVIHCAAYTNVDKAETDADEAYKVNAIGTRNIASISEKYSAKLVYISTDYVFNGESNGEYNEFSPTSPLGVYGKSKLAGEDFVRALTSKFFIVRTSWVFGLYGKNFVKTMLNLAQDKKELNVVNDQRGCPTYTVDLAHCISRLIRTEKYGTYHCSNSGNCTWYEFAKAIFEEAGFDMKVTPVGTEEFPRPAKRPTNSVFDHMSLRLNEFPEMRNWREALRTFIKELAIEGNK